MFIAYKYKIKPTEEQKLLLSKIFGCVRWVYNWGLDSRIKAYKEEDRSLSSYALIPMLTQLKKDSNYSWLKDVPVKPLYQSLAHLDNAFDRFFKHCKTDKKMGFPKFKTKRGGIDVAEFVGHGLHVDFKNWRVSIPRVGWVSMCYNRRFNMSKFKIFKVTVSKDRCGDYWCSIDVQDKNPFPPKTKVESEKTIGIDLGLTRFITLSDGTYIANPGFFEKALPRLKTLQKRHSRKQSGSKRKERARIKMAKCFRKISNRTKDFINKLTSQLIASDYTSFAVESLNIKDMLKNPNLSRPIGNVSWYEFVRQLQYKSEWAGKNVLYIGEFEPSSKVCSVCGSKNDELTLKDRIWTCSKCGTNHDRDINAAINIKNIALSKL